MLKESIHSLKMIILSCQSKDAQNKRTLIIHQSIHHAYLVNPKVHGMRDHPAHGAVMMGGMWGAKVDRTRKQ